METNKDILADAAEKPSALAWPTHSFLPRVIVILGVIAFVLVSIGIAFPGCAEQLSCVPEWVCYYLIFGAQFCLACCLYSGLRRALPALRGAAVTNLVCTAGMFLLWPAFKAFPAEAVSIVGFGLVPLVAFALCVVFVLVQIIVLALAGVKLRRYATGRLRRLGTMFLFVPALFWLLELGVFAGASFVPVLAYIVYPAFLIGLFYFFVVHGTFRSLTAKSQCAACGKALPLFVIVCAVLSLVFAIVVSVVSGTDDVIDEGFGEEEFIETDDFVEDGDASFTEDPATVGGDSVTADGHDSLPASEEEPVMEDAQ